MATLDRDGPDEPGAPPVPETAPAPQVVAAQRPGRRRRVRLRLALLAVVALAVVGLVGVGLLNWPAGPSLASVTVGSDGIPNQIDGQRVYRTQDVVDWLDLRGSFLLGGRVSSEHWLIGPCTGPITPERQALLDLRGCHPGVSLEGTAGTGLWVAPRGSKALSAWDNALVVFAFTPTTPKPPCATSRIEIPANPHS